MSRLAGMIKDRVSEWRQERRSWELREEGHANVSKFRALVEAREKIPSLDEDAREMLKAAEVELASADQLLDFGDHRRASLGSHVTAAQIHVNAARLFWVKSFFATPEKISPYLPSLQEVVREHLPARDGRRKSVEGIDVVSTPDQLVKLTEAVEAANSVALHEKLRAASFVRLVWRVAGSLFFLAVAVAVLTAHWSNVVPLCFNPAKSVGMVQALPNPKSPVVDYTVVCPTGSDEFPRTRDLDDNFAAVASWGDYLVVEVVGLVAAGLAAAASLRNIRGTATPFRLPVALAMLKLPAGALTAVLGILLMRGAFVPGLSALDSSAQIIAWAVIFGYSQELFTKFVDRRGQMVLDAVRGPTSPPLVNSGSGGTRPAAGGAGT
ncbi:hypothetical protein NMG29_34670 [Streptomyces cocklensis]|uniref:Uncharacterized protein n=1 Tax=Actinacidiphila cocklensis TaxID=887465 RepID=A0A9W4DPF4_9ACTN|nr:hypothetical protein [Actinacidiphila cocklensis]MDD1063258.1 hypothetical protein [Actinacidiphila cocklensis]CAG6393698.1 conserved membrane hypothetical protein [Actinacidiphila cocklensis]